MFSLDFRAHSETGLVRKNNQDSAYASPTALVVADGMGGAAAGDLASAIAIQEVARSDRELEGDEMLVALSGAVAHANDLIADLVSEEPALDGMGTTVCGAMFSGEQLGLVHIGDSRAYLFRDGRLTRLSHDHSWVQSLVDEGKLHEEDMSTHPHRSLLLRVLNGQASNTPDTDLIDVQLGDRVLFCSDGLSGFTTDAELARLLALDDLDAVVPGLIAAAHEGGGADNITFVVADLVPFSEQLAHLEPVLLGAVADGDLGEILATATSSPITVPAALPPHARQSASDDDEPMPRTPTVVDHERLRYLPTKRRRRWLPTVALLATLVIALGAAGAGGLLYSRSQYYVGAAPTSDGESVAIFRGLPDNLLGLKLSNVVEVEDTLVRDLPTYYRQQVQDTIGSSDVDSARATAQQLHDIAQQCIALRTAAANTPSPSPSPSTKPSTKPSTTAKPRTSASSSPARSASASHSPTPSHSPSPNATGSPSPGSPTSLQDCS